MYSNSLEENTKKKNLNEKQFVNPAKNRFEELNIKIYSFVANSDVKKMSKNSGHFLEFEIGSLFFFWINIIRIRYTEISFLA